MSIDAEIIDTLLFRYKSLDYIYGLDMDSGIDFIAMALQKDREDKDYLRWITGGYDKTISFTEFREKLNIAFNSQSSNKSSEEILEDVKSILDSMTEAG